MDEPSEGLAPLVIQHLWEIIGRLRDDGLSILLVEQNAVLALKREGYRKTDVDLVDTMSLLRRLAFWRAASAISMFSTTVRLA